MRVFKRIGGFSKDRFIGHLYILINIAPNDKKCYYNITEKRGISIIRNEFMVELLYYPNIEFFKKMYPEAYVEGKFLVREIPVC